MDEKEREAINSLVKYFKDSLDVAKAIIRQLEPQLPADVKLTYINPLDLDKDVVIDTDGDVPTFKTEQQTYLVSPFAPILSEKGRADRQHVEELIRLRKD